MLVEVVRRGVYSRIDGVVGCEVTREVITWYLPCLPLYIAK